MNAIRCPSPPIAATEPGFPTCAKLLDPASLTVIGKDFATSRYESRSSHPAPYTHPLPDSFFQQGLTHPRTCRFTQRETTRSPDAHRRAHRYEPAAPARAPRRQLQGLLPSLGVRPTLTIAHLSFIRADCRLSAIG